MQDHAGKSKSAKTDKPCVDIVTVGERGQVVIPAAIREQIGLQAGDKLMVFLKHSEMICLIPTSSMRRLVDILNDQLAGTDDTTAKTNTKEN